MYDSIRMGVEGHTVVAHSDKPYSLNRKFIFVQTKYYYMHTGC